MQFKSGSSSRKYGPRQIRPESYFLGSLALNVMLLKCPTLQVLLIFVYIYFKEYEKEFLKYSSELLYF